MSSEQTFSTSDLRSTAQDYKRYATRKHKWALGGVATGGRAAGGKPRPHRPSETSYNAKRRAEKAAAAGTKTGRTQDMMEGTAISDDSSTSASDYDGAPSPSTDAGVMYSFDAPRAPSEGSQILNAALAKAVAKYEERETVKLVKDEYEVLNDDGESVGLSPVKKGRNKGPAAASVTPSIAPEMDEDYEFV